MIESGKPADVNLKKLKTIFVEGSLLPIKYHKMLQELLPDVDTFHWYGQTEAGELTTFRKIDLHRTYNSTKPGCVGTPIVAFGACLKVSKLEIRRNRYIELSITFISNCTLF